MRQPLRLLISVSFVATTFLSVDAQNTGINRNGASPNPKAILDLDVSATSGNPYQGMLIPRMTFGQRLAITVSNATGVDQGLWVYQTDDGTDPGGDPTLDAEYARGYWYYEYISSGNILNRWVRWSTSNASWQLTGNAGTVVGTNYLGTQGAQDLYIRTTNNLASNPTMRILGSGTDAGFVGINLGAAPVERVEVNGGVQVGYSNALNTLGAIRHENTSVTPNRWHTGNVDGTATGWKRMENAETRYINQNYCPIIQQCGSTDGLLVKGVYDGTPVASTVGGPVHTPFATRTNANQQNGYRVQYIYPGAELLAAGLCPGFITKFSFYALTTDFNFGAAPPCIPFVSCPDIKVDIRMGNTALGTFGPVVNSSIAITGVDWDAPTEASAQIFTNALVAQLIQTGWVDFPLNGAGFNWTGGNMIIDLSWIRANPIGTSPAVQLEEALAYTATKWVQVTNANNPLHGNTYQDNPLTASATNGTTNTRPVTRFYGKVASPAYGAVTSDEFLNYGGGLMIDDNVLPTTWADGAYKGPGTIRASLAVYDGNTALSDHVFDRYYDGDVAPQDAEQAEGYTYVGLPDLKGYLERERHLPNMPSREEWDLHGSPSLGQLQTGLWESVETQAIYITQLEKDLGALESLAFAQLKDADEIEHLISDVKNSRRLTEAQKLHVTDALQARLNAQKDNK